MSGRRGSGSSLAAAARRTAGYAIGEDRTSPWLEAIAGIRQRSSTRGERAPLGLGFTAMVEMSEGCEPPEIFGDAETGYI